MDLKEYEQRKFELSEILRTIVLRSKDLKARGSDSPADLLGRLAEDRFNLVLVGRTSRGKSSLMNALLGTDRLPTGVLPVTSVITAVGYGSRERAFIKHIGWNLDREISLAALTDYVSQEGNPANARGVAVARVELPCELLRRGLYLVDTPGLGSAFFENTRTTARYLPHADAYMLVTSYEAPLSEEELHLLRTIAPTSRRVFVVVNKQDVVSRTEREAVEAHVDAQLTHVLGSAKPHVFSLSAREAISGQQNGDRQLVESSGVEQLRDALIRFLLEDRQAELLMSMCLRIGELVRGLPGLAQEADRIAQLHQALRSKAGAPAQSAGSASMSAAPAFRDCAICDRIESEVYNFLCTYQYDAAVQSDVRTALAEDGGLCEFHTWEYEAVASPRGTCIAFSAVLERLEGGLRAAAGQRSRIAITSALRNIGAKSTGCAMCRARGEAESSAIADFLRAVLDGGARGSFAGVCIPHLRILVGHIGDELMLRRLILDEAAATERLREDMQRYVLKFDGIRRHLASEEETTADRRALVLLAGRRSVNSAKAAP